MKYIKTFECYTEYKKYDEYDKIDENWKSTIIATLLSLSSLLPMTTNANTTANNFTFKPNLVHVPSKKSSSHKERLEARLKNIELKDAKVKEIKEQIEDIQTKEDFYNIVKMLKKYAIDGHCHDKELITILNDLSKIDEYKDLSQLKKELTSLSTKLVNLEYRWFSDAEMSLLILITITISFILISGPEKFFGTDKK